MSKVKHSIVHALAGAWIYIYMAVSIGHFLRYYKFTSFTCTRTSVPLYYIRLKLMAVSCVHVQSPQDHLDRLPLCDQS